MDKEPKIGDDEIQEWSRHYDNLLWVVNSIFMAALGGLLIYIFGEDKESPVLCIAGLVLVLLAVYFIMGFRVFRSNLHSQIANSKLREFLANPNRRRGIKQWDVYVSCLLFLVSIPLILRLRSTLGGPDAVYVATFALMAAFIYPMWRRGRGEGKR